MTVTYVNGVKRCKHCKKIKSIEEFYIDKSGYNKGKPRSNCKTCSSELAKEWEKDHTDYTSKRNHLLGKTRPMAEAKECATYLGIYVAEKVLSQAFENVTRMPMGNPGYDFICEKGRKVDCKSSCLQYYGTRNGMWRFNITHNKIADYFLCIGFDDRTNLNPMHVWMIPNELVSQKSMLGITNSQRILKKWEEYERPIDKIGACCAKMRK